MTEHTAIEWCTHTFSPWLGCTPVSAACDHCYAAALARRYGWPAYRAGVPRRRSAASTWKLPRRWQRRAAANGVRASVFPSLCDPFDGEVGDAWRDDFVAEIEATPDLDWLLLTKRPHLAAKYWARRRMPANVALGVTAETQAMADLRIPQLLAIEGPNFRFVSIEPMLGPIDLTAIPRARAEGFMRPLDGRFRTLDWVIAGGESGPNSRASHPAWFRDLRDQCVAAGVAFFFKQWGDWAPSTEEAARGNPRSGWRMLRGHPHLPKVEELYPANGAAFVANVGKKVAGAELDGRHWRQLPPQLQVGTS